MIHPFLSTRPRRFDNASLTNFDPLRRLACAVVAQAALDYFWPKKSDSRLVRLDAETFLHSDEGLALIRAVGIPPAAVREVLGEQFEMATTGAGDPRF